MAFLAGFAARIRDENPSEVLCSAHPLKTNLGKDFTIHLP